MRPLSRFGFLDMEKALVLFLIVMALGAVVASYRIWSYDRPSAGPADSWLNACQSCLLRLNQDLKYSRLVSLASDSVCVETPAGKEILFQFSGGMLIRSEGKAGKNILLSNIEKGFFSPHPSIPRLISVVMTSKNRQDLPFFTSFFPRHEPEQRETENP
jgi:hypothetical protein